MQLINSLKQMKFIRLTLSFNLKAILLLTLLLSNIFVETNETIKLSKTLSKYERLQSSRSSAKRTSRRTTRRTSKATRRFQTNDQMRFKEKFKAFMIGFTAAVVVKSIKNEDGGVVNKLITAAVDWCFESTFNNYELIKQKMVKESPCNPDHIKVLLGTDFQEIETKCAELDTIRKLDDNEFSSLNVILGTVKSLVVENKEFKDSYAKFKEDKEKLEKFSDTITEKYREKLKGIFEDKHKFTEPVREVAKTLHGKITGIVFKDDFCTTISSCNAFGTFDHLKVIYASSIDLLKCSLTAQIKNPLWYMFQDLVNALFKKLGSGILTTIAAGILPGVLLGLLIKFVLTNWSAMKQFTDSFFTLNSDDPKNWNAEKDMWNSIGRLLAGLLFTILGVRKRKLKKFRKFDSKLF